MNIYTFENFYTKFHYVTKQYRTRKQQARNLWDKQINLSVKIKAFDNITNDIKVNAYDYLQKQFKLG